MGVSATIVEQSHISWVFLAEEDFAAGRDLGATGLIKPVAILSRLHTWFALRQYENPFRQKGPALAINGTTLSGF